MDTKLAIHGGAKTATEPYPMWPSLAEKGIREGGRRPPLREGQLLDRAPGHGVREKVGGLERRQVRHLDLERDLRPPHGGRLSRHRAGR